ncbi:MAG: rhodanese-like domain-containing protein [Proteobacteria bacterium]|nr:rhodanese-like domain-containing protein [Pseudomonadota bacterium]
MTIKNIDHQTLKKWLENQEAVLVDVREPAENAASKIDGSHLLPLASVSLKSLPKSDGKKLVIHCGSGKRSYNACVKLLAEDSSLEVYNLEGGISAWNAAGNKVESSGKFFLPLDRQVQLVIGLAVFLGSILGYFVDPLFFILSGFFGAGLCFAAVTGYCGLAIFLAKMPWNKNVATRSFSCATK